MTQRDLNLLFSPAQMPAAMIQALLASDPADLPGLARIEGGDAAPELCQLGERWRPADHPALALGQVKVDGYRALYIGGLLVSREGVPMTQAAHSYRALQELERAFGKPMFFDGEYAHPDGFEACGQPGGTIWLFDAVPLDIWRRDGPSARLDQRLDMLLDRGQHCFGPALGALMPLPIRTAQEAQAKATELIALGYEGLFVKDRTSHYRRRRHGSWRKIKDWRTVRCRIIDILGDRQSKPRSIIVRHEGKDNRVGNGFNHEVRVKLAQIAVRGPAFYRGSAVIEFAGYTKNGLMRDAAFIGLEEEGGN